jgi:type IV pilus assembly protein PilQ
VNGALNLDLALSALEQQGKLTVISTPRVSTQNNIEAEITQGTQIPIQVVANNTITVQFKDAALKLLVTPQITASNTVIMRINLENAQADFGRSVNGIPPIDTQRADHGAHRRRADHRDRRHLLQLAGEPFHADAGAPQHSAARLAVQGQLCRTTRTTTAHLHHASHSQGRG